MADKKELLEMAVINLTCENAELKYIVQELREKIELKSKWLEEDKAKIKSLSQQLESLTSHSPEGSDANPALK
jgi:hypothetical protein